MFASLAVVSGRLDDGVVGYAQENWVALPPWTWRSDPPPLAIPPIGRSWESGSATPRLLRIAAVASASAPPETEL